jgi:pyruvate,orthophosphate dikinase
MSKNVYFFGAGEADGSAADKNLLGSKGANLAEMVRLGLPVPPGFTIATTVCADYNASGGHLPEEASAEIEAALARVEALLGAKFGDPDNPLLVSARSGARVSMPGMMETILNIGLNDQTAEGLAKKTGDVRFARDCHRRFLQMHASTAMGASRDPYERAIDDLKKERGVRLDVELSADDLAQLIQAFKRLTRQLTGRDVPQDPREQLREAIEAVFGSWRIEKARIYRQLNHIPEDWGTAVNIQAMVFGNAGPTSATGVAFTRHPATGDPRLFGEYLPNAQGEDVVAGIRSPQPISQASAAPGEVALEQAMPAIHAQLLEIRDKLEARYRDMQDIEFTVQDGRLWMLQTRTGKRTGMASLRIATDMVDEGLISPEEAVRRFEPTHLEQLLAPVFDPKEKEEALRAGRLLAKGVKASPGAACGMAALSAGKASEFKAANKPALLARVETSPEDIGGMAAAQGILTARGGATSHAAVVARGMGKPCVCGAESLEVDYDKREIRAGGRVVREGDFLSIDGTAGEILLGRLGVKPSEIVQSLRGEIEAGKSDLFQRFQKLMGWVDEFRVLGVRVNADSPADAKLAAALGAEGIGLCRTEHMFFQPERLLAMREMIMAESVEERRAALAKIEPFQREDFAGLFAAMEGRPVTIRLLDPPLHEFLPSTREQVSALARETGLDANRLRDKAAELHEINPMLGHRGCRLGISHPEITEMQARAIFRAAAERVSRGQPVDPEVMVPLVGHEKEFLDQKAIVDRVAAEVRAETGVSFSYKVGAMIEVPRAALRAGVIAQDAEFFSFGTNDLTQMALGFSRDDAEKTFLGVYADKRIYPRSPFKTLDREGVGELMRIAVERGLATRPNLKIGICGEHGGDPDSIEFCHGLKLHYVSCSPYRVPVARLAAARAALQEKA